MNGVYSTEKEKPKAIKKMKKGIQRRREMAPSVGIEPTTTWLKAMRSTG